MTRFCLTLMLIVTGGLLAVGSLSLSAFAQSEASDLFKVQGVSVDVQGKDAVDAREKALAAGGRIALRKIAQRLSISGSLPKLKRADVEGLIENYLVESEKSSNTRYIAVLTFELDEEAVRTLFQENGLLFSESKSDPILVLPVWQGETGPVLFRRGNPWKAAWDGVDLETGSLLPILSALGDLQDVSMMPAQKALAADKAAIQAIAAKYEISKVLIISAEADGDKKITIKGTVYGANGTTGDSVRLAVTGEEQLSEAVTQVHASLLQQWKQRSGAQGATGDDTNLETMQVLFQLRDFSHWRQLQTALDDQNVVRRYDLEALSKKRAVLKLHHAGGVSRLKSGLLQKSLFLLQDQNREVWWIYFRSDGPPKIATQPVQVPTKLPTDTTVKKTNG